MFYYCIRGKFLYLYKYKDDDLQIIEKRKALDKDFYVKYLFDQNPYIFFEDTYLKGKKSLQK